MRVEVQLLDEGVILTFNAPEGTKVGDRGTVYVRDPATGDFLPHQGEVVSLTSDYAGPARPFFPTNRRPVGQLELEGRAAPPSATHYAILDPDAGDAAIESFVAALAGSRRYNPNQPRRPDGKWGSGGLAAVGGMSEFGPSAHAAIATRCAKIKEGPPPNSFPQSSDEVAANLKEVYGRATPDQIEAGKNWYRDESDAVRKMAEANPPLTFEQGCAITAKCSPGREWEDNREIAGRIMKVHADDEPFEIDQATYDSMRTKPTRGPGKYRPSELEPEQLAYAHPAFKGGATYDHVGQVAAGIEIARGGDIDKIVGGPKVRNFYNNLHDPSDPRAVTIDTWEVRAGIKPGELLPAHGAGPPLGSSVGYADRAVDIQYVISGPSNKPGGLLKGTGLYPMFYDGVVQAANDLGVLPCELQAVTWLVVRAEQGG